jgi:release factor glutamine methyltransferase
MTYGEWHRYLIQQLGKIYPAGEAKSIVRLVFEDALQLNSVRFFMETNKEVEPATHKHLEQILNRLLQYEPVQYITGSADFYGLKFKVNPHVLIPRPETEELVKWILTDIKENSSIKKTEIIDIGAGCGCIAIAIKKNYADAGVVAMDISEGALAVARENAAMNSVEVNFIAGDILTYKPASNLRYDIVVSNPPYIKKSEQQKMSPNVLNYEPHSALFVNDNEALIFYKAISKFAAATLTAKGSLYFEINESLSAEVKKLLTKSAFQNIVIRKDINGKERMVRCSAPTTTSGNQ